MISKSRLNCQGLKSFLYKITAYFEKVIVVIENTIVGKFVTEKTIRELELAKNALNLEKKLS